MSNKSRWTRDEEINLVKNISGGATFTDLAIKHDRSENAIELRLKQIIYENILSGKSIDTLAKTLNINNDKIQQYYYSYKDFIEKKSGGHKSISSNIHKSINTSHIDNTVNNLVTNKHSNQTHLSITEMTGGKSNTHDKFNTEYTNNIHKINSKLKKLELENKIIKLVVENKDLTAKLNDLIQNNRVDSNVKNVIKFIRNSKI